MDYPQTIYIGIGAVVAAAITGIISFINLIATKDQKTSEFRQQWIDGLRNNISEYLAHTSSVSSQAHLYIQLNGEGELKAEVLKEFSEKVSVNMMMATQLFHSIQLRLNKKDDKKLLDSIIALDDLFANAIINMSDPAKVDEFTSPIITQSQDLLKEEWKRVKRGEPSFYITKYISIALVIASIVFSTIYYLCK